MDKEELQEIVEKRRKEGWIDAWFAFEVVATSEEVAENAMKNHIEGLEKVRNVLVYEKSFQEVREVDAKPFNVEKAYSKTAEVKILLKNVETLVHVTIVFAPSAIEIYSPSKLEIKIDELQNISNLLAGLIHQFAGARLGGVIIKT
jgi:hypothetical protein